MAPNAPFSDLQHVIFTGVPNNGIIRSPIELQTDGNDPLNDWNLLGNPYPSAIDAELLLNHHNNKDLINGTFYFWTHTTAITNKDEDGTESYSSDDYAMYTIEPAVSKPALMVSFQLNISPAARDFSLKRSIKVILSLTIP